MKYHLPAWFTGFLLSSLLLVSCDNEAEPDPSIAGIAVAQADFSVLEDAAVRGGVVEVLSNKNPNDPEGNYTVFAPNNAAFARLGFARGADLQLLQTPFLTQALLNHVASGAVAGSSLQAGFRSPSALGLQRRVTSNNGTLYVNGARILATDVKASNGVVHVVDKLLLGYNGTIVEAAVALSQGKVFVQPQLTFLVEAVQYCPDVATALSGTNQFTVFAPTDQAFRDLLTQLLGPGNYEPRDVRRLQQSTVQAVLLNSALSNGLFTPELPASGSTASAGGGTLTFGPFTNGVLTVRGNGNASNNANMIIPDVQCTNGVVHVIDRVLLP